MHGTTITICNDILQGFRNELLTKFLCGKLLNEEMKSAVLIFNFGTLCRAHSYKYLLLNFVLSDFTSILVMCCSYYKQYKSHTYSANGTVHFFF